jgi:hypothetical protein
MKTLSFITLLLALLFTTNVDAQARAGQVVGNDVVITQ